MLSDRQMKALISFVSKRIKEKKLVPEKIPVEDYVREVISKNMEEERHIEAQTVKLMDQMKNQMSENIDSRKMFHMIKKKIASEKKFVL
ncbi:MAG: DUF507 family protein [Deltaproteobacteria bacterium]|nr:DUF507 family protein [Deltaproteobacteria bacterium]